MSDADSIPLLIKNPHCPDYVFSTRVPSHSSVGDVKSQLSSTYRGSPAAVSQWLVCAGRLLADGEQLRDVYASQAAAAVAGQELILHLAIRGARNAASSAAANASAQQQQSAAQLPPLSSSPLVSSATSSSSFSPSPSPSVAAAVSTSELSGRESAPAVASSPFVAPLAGYGLWPYGLPSAHQLQLAWQWQQMAAAAHQAGGLRQRQVSAPSAQSASPAATSSAAGAAGSAALFSSAIPATSAVHPFHGAALRTLPSPFFISPFAIPATSPLASHLALTSAALPPFASSPASTLPTASSLSPPSSTAAAAASSSSSPLSSFSDSSSSPSAGAAAAGSAADPSTVAAAGQSSLSAIVSAFRRYLDIRLLLKLSVLLLVFSRQGDSTRSMLLLAAAVVAYLWQVGLLRRRPTEPNEQLNADGAANNEAEGRGGGVEREALAHARREAREERRAGANGGAAGGGLGGLLAGMAGEGDEDDEEEDINLQREQLHIIQQQHQAELIRRGQRQAGHSETGQSEVQLDTWMSATEKLVVGLFASLVPSWRPTIDVQ